MAWVRYLVSVSLVINAIALVFMAKWMREMRWRCHGLQSELHASREFIALLLSRVEVPCDICGNAIGHARATVTITETYRQIAHAICVPPDESET